MKRNFQKELNNRGYNRQAGYNFPRGTTATMPDTLKIWKNLIEVTPMATEA